VAELYEIQARNFRTLKHVSVPLGRLTVLVGPNAAGKSNLIDVVGFLRDAARSDLARALGVRGGFGRVHFRGDSEPWMSLFVSCQVTPNASHTAPDDYFLRIDRLGVKGSARNVIRRKEEFTFKRTKGRGRRITISGSQVRVTGQQMRKLLKDESLGLSTLPRLTTQGGYQEVEALAGLLSSFRVFDVDVDAARLPSPILSAEELELAEDMNPLALAPDASNLSAFFLHLANKHSDAFDALQRDAGAIIPGLAEIAFAPVGGSSEAVAVELLEERLNGRTTLAEASFGSIRLLALLALLHDPEPPALTCVEEFDHGLHPYAFDLLVERLREASTRTQILLATHSPTLVNRLRGNELVVCERDPATGASRIPAISPDELEAVAKAADEHDLRLGEVWFSGSLGGVLPS
jgi:predicted ATPase